MRTPGAGGPEAAAYQQALAHTGNAATAAHLRARAAGR